MACDRIDAYGAALDRISTRVDAFVMAATGLEALVIYSAYETGPDPDNVPIDNLDEVAVKGRVKLVQLKDEFYGGKSSKNYCSEVLTNPTWLEVCVCADAMIRTTNDHHHAFLEGLEKVGKQSQKDPDFTLYEFVMGS